MTKLLLCLSLGSLVVAGLACAPKAPLPTTLEGRYDTAWDASLAVLRDYHFRVDRLDRREGVITTYPLTGASWFELHRRDAATDRDAMESTLQTIHRAAEVRLCRSAGGYYFPRVRVRVSRAFRPRRQITNASEAYELFQLDSPTRRHRRPWLAAQPPQQVDLGEDEQLAANIQADIDQRLGR